MTHRERLLKVIAGELPDRVPVAPDFSNMIPAKLTGLPFWDLYLYQKIPIWKAYIDAAKYFGIDSLMDGYCPVEFDDIYLDKPDDRKRAIVYRSDDRIVTQRYIKHLDGRMEWDGKVDVYYIDNPPTEGLLPESIRLPKIPDRWEPLMGVCEQPRGEALLRLVKKEMGDTGLVGIVAGTSILLHNENDIFDYYDDPAPFEEKRDRMLDYFLRKLDRLASMPEDARPDFICTGGSGTLVFQTPEIFMNLGYPIVRAVTKKAKEYGFPSHVHSCGRETMLLEMCEDTDLTIIDPLEIPPMGDCNLKELKKRFGSRYVLKGNLHTTNVMLKGTPEQVMEASRKAIEDAAEGGRFILSTGDQCGRDTPFENIFAMIEAAEKYGRYDV